MRTQEWIRAALKERGYKLKDVAEGLQIAPPRVSDILKGAREVQSDEIVPLSELLGLSTASLLKSLQEGKRVIVPGDTVARIPVAGCLTGTGIVEPLPENHSFKNVPVPPDAESAEGLHCYVMGDESMGQEIRAGSLIIAADPRQHYFPMVPGAIFLIKLEAEPNKLFLRQYLKTEAGEDWLVPLPVAPNPAYESLRFSLLPESLTGKASQASPGAAKNQAAGTETQAHKIAGTENIVAGVLWVHQRHMPAASS